MNLDAHYYSQLDKTQVFRACGWFGPFRRHVIIRIEVYIVIICWVLLGQKFGLNYMIAQNASSRSAGEDNQFNSLLIFPAKKHYPKQNLPNWPEQV